jgi:hypothetical protein
MERKVVTVFFHLLLQLVVVTRHILKEGTEVVMVVLAEAVRLVKAGVQE